MLKAILTDVDGTITDPARRIDTGAIEVIRSLVDDGVEVVLASGNTSCFMDALCKTIGTGGSFIAENGGVYRVGYTGTLRLDGDQGVCRTALETVQAHYRKKGIELELYNPTYRYTDLAFARTVPAEEVLQVLAGEPVQVIDTGFAIHLQSEGVSKGTALLALADDLDLSPKDFFAIGDGINDVQMLQWACGRDDSECPPGTKTAASDVMEEAYGKGFVQATKKYRSYFRAM